MERLRSFVASIKANEPEYEPLTHDAGPQEQDGGADRPDKPSFSWLEYSAFVVIGLAMLWAW